ncbi:MAG TPA: hypothetical protein VEA19_01170 [Actinomycetota bacterium]|nr:hypothetical protein [Actinomycetota bacterium]
MAAEVRAGLGVASILAIDERANGFGVESRGAFQIRGNGCLALTADELVFVLWLPRRELRIPRARITAVERTRWHLGKTVGRELLKVRFESEGGAPDSAAWLVRDLSLWEALLSA